MSQVQVAPLPGEEPWVPPPIEGDLRWPDRTIFGGVATWTALKLKTHQTCTTCVEVCLDADRAGKSAPHPMPATQKRVGPMGPKAATYHCSRHAQALKQKDDEIKAKRERMLAEVQLKTTAARRSGRAA